MPQYLHGKENVVYGLPGVINDIFGKKGEVVYHLSQALLELNNADTSRDNATEVFAQDRIEATTRRGVSITHSV
jgi:hypothetical protein